MTTAIARAATNRRLTGHNSALPGTYGLSHEEMAFLMDQWRARALA
jgi:hypothetical protein